MAGGEMGRKDRERRRRRDWETVYVREEEGGKEK